MPDPVIEAMNQGAIAALLAIAAPIYRRPFALDYLLIAPGLGHATSGIVLSHFSAGYDVVGNFKFAGGVNVHNREAVDPFVIRRVILL